MQATLDTDRASGASVLPISNRESARATETRNDSAAVPPRRSEPDAPERPKRAELAPSRDSAAPRSTDPAPRMEHPVEDRPGSDPSRQTQSPVTSPRIDASGNPITVDLLHDLWPKIRLDIKARDRRIEALLSSCDPASVNGASITLVTSYKFHWEKMNEDASRELVESVIGRLVNQPVSITTEIRGANAANSPPTPVSRDPGMTADRSITTAEPDPSEATSSL